MRASKGLIVHAWLGFTCGVHSAWNRLRYKSCVHGHHIYQSIWKPRIGQSLQCEHEQGNLKDPYTIAVLDNMCRYIKTVCHLPRKISPACSVFLRKGGHTTCIVTAHRHYSADLPQGGLEVPRSLKFNGKQKKYEN